jgi:hypothetical protein
MFHHRGYSHEHEKEQSERYQTKHEGSRRRIPNPVRKTGWRPSLTRFRTLRMSSGFSRVAGKGFFSLRHQQPVVLCASRRIAQHRVRLAYLAKTRLGYLGETYLCGPRVSCRVGMVLFG